MRHTNIHTYSPARTPTQTHSQHHHQRRAKSLWATTHHQQPTSPGTCIIILPLCVCVCVPPTACRSIIYNAKLLHHHKYVRRTLVVVPRCALTVCFSHIAQSASEWLGGVIWNRRARTHVLFYLSLSAAKCECDAVCSGGGDAKFTPGSTNWQRVQIWHVRIYVWETPLFYSSGRQEKVLSVFFYI
jgi:hypothetical protein